MLVPDIFSPKGKPIPKGMKIINRTKQDGEVYILNLKGTAYCDDNLEHTTNWTMFKHISITKKDMKKLVKEIQSFQEVEHKV